MMPRRLLRDCPALGRLLQFFEEEEVHHGHRDLETAISSKELTRTNFFGEASWAILVSGFKWEVASIINEKARDVAFRSPGRFSANGEMTSSTRGASRWLPS